MDIIDLSKECVIKWRITDACNYHCSYCIRRELVKGSHTIQGDFEKSFSVIEDVKRIAQELYDVNNKFVKIDLIGGEISLYKDLDKFIDLLYESPIIIRLNITTNLSQDASYYLRLCEIAKKHNKQLSMTASFHPEYEDLNNFIQKSVQIDKEIHEWFKCETVISDVNIQYKDFIKLCEENNLYYMAEEDLQNQKYRGQTIKNKKTNMRYKIIDDRGIETEYSTRNEVLKRYGIKGMAIPTRGCKCTRDNDYVYIEFDCAIPCRRKVKIKDYHISKYPRVCDNNACTLCGHMSIYS